MRRVTHRTGSGSLARSTAVVGAVLAGAVGLGAGCDALNPAFLEVALPEDVQRVATTENARGHVPVFVINNTRFDGQLLDYLASQGIDTTQPGLRPRVRLFIRVQFVNGNAVVFEYLDGSQVVQASADIGGQTQFVGVLPPDLTDTELTNQVVQCDVSRVEVLFGDASLSTIEVFVPVFLKEIEIQQGTAIGAPPTRQLIEVTLPQFVPLQVDDVDAALSVITLRNLGIRDVPAPVQDLTCGSVVAFILEGTLTVPFVEDENGALVPGFLNTDAASQAAIPGRYRVVTTIR